MAPVALCRGTSWWRWLRVRGWAGDWWWLRSGLVGRAVGGGCGARVAWGWWWLRVGVLVVAPAVAAGLGDRRRRRDPAARVLVVAPGLLCWGGVQQRPEDVDRKSFIRKESPNTGTATVSPMSPTLAVTHHRWRPPAGLRCAWPAWAACLRLIQNRVPGLRRGGRGLMRVCGVGPRGLRSGGWVSDRRQQGSARQRTPERGRAMGRTCGWHSCAADPGAGQLRFRAGCGDQRPGSGPRCRPRCRGLCRPALGGLACSVRRDARCPVLRPRGRTHRRMGAAARVARTVEAARTPPVTAPDGPAAFGCGYGAVAGRGCLPRGRSHRRVGVSAGGWVVRRGCRPRG